MRDIDPVDLIEATRHAPGLSLAMYQSLMEQTAKKPYVYRHYCSAVCVSKNR